MHHNLFIENQQAYKLCYDTKEASLLLQDIPVNSKMHSIGYINKELY